MGPPRPRQNCTMGATDHRTPTSTSTTQPRPEFVQGSSRSSAPPAAPAPDAMDTDEQPSATSSITAIPVPPPASDLPSIDNLDHFLDGDDDEEDEDEIDLEEVQHRESRARARRARVVASRPPPSTTGTCTQAEPSPTEPPYDDVVAPSLPHGVPTSATRDQWPTNLPWPTTTEVRLADAWHDYVPQSIDQASALMREARDQQGGALQRARHLIAQIDTQSGYLAIPGLTSVKNNCQPAVRPPRHGQAMPTHADPPARWATYYQDYPHSIPRQLVTNPAHPEQVPPLDMIEGYMLMRRFVPPTGKSEGLQCAQLLAVIARAFSVLDFYERMITHHHLRVATTEDLKPVPGPIANVGEIDVIRWAVQCGMTRHTSLLISNVARRCRNQDLGRALDSMEVWPDFPSSLEDVPTYVASSSTTILMTNPVEPSSDGLVPQEDVEMTGEGSAQTEQPVVDVPAGGIHSEAAIDLVKDATTVAHPYEMTTRLVQRTWDMVGIKTTQDLLQQEKALCQASHGSDDYNLTISRSDPFKLVDVLT
ncbi:hypothetical protein C8Q74DRAFT_1222170 [Fomes fomentarius]|nr:hypothetical protein C8Q74DRAFT_1222170 [Fomes fomentarius]